MEGDENAGFEMAVGHMCDGKKLGIVLRGELFNRLGLKTTKDLAMQVMRLDEE